eukprot:13305300-Heterocapsa_arctica.AAC.1
MAKAGLEKIGQKNPDDQDGHPRRGTRSQEDRQAGFQTCLRGIPGHLFLRQRPRGRRHPGRSEKSQGAEGQSPKNREQ